MQASAPKIGSAVSNNQRDTKAKRVYWDKLNGLCFLIVHSNTLCYCLLGFKSTVWGSSSVKERRAFEPEGRRLKSFLPHKIKSSPSSSVSERRDKDCGGRWVQILPRGQNITQTHGF